MRLPFRLGAMLVLSGVAMWAPTLAQGAPIAGGTVDLSWNDCTPLDANQDLMNPASEPIALYVTVTGHDVPHKAYQAWFVIGNESSMLPDAWRFDADGCQGAARITIDHLAPPEQAAACPSFQGDLSSLQIKLFQLSPPGLGYPTTMGNGLILNAYPAGNSQQIDPGQRYFLARFLFDHSQSVLGPAAEDGTCGGYGDCMVVQLVPQKCSWLDLADFEYQFQLGRSWASVHGGFPPFGTCSATPATSTTWGAIKAQYR